MGAAALRVGGRRAKDQRDAGRRPEQRDVKEDGTKSELANNLHLINLFNLSILFDI